MSKHSESFSVACQKKPALGIFPGFKVSKAIWYENSKMERIDPQQDHENLLRFKPGCQVVFKGKPYTVQRRTTLASGEAAVVLQGEKEQFLIPATEFLAGVE